VRQLLVLPFIVALFAVPGTALNPGKTLTQYAHRVWGQEEGLFQPTIYSILQTRDGFLWLGTQDSLIRFDGVRFREFGEKEPVFYHSLIRALLEDRHGNLWVGSIGGGVAKIMPTGIVVRYTPKEGVPGDAAFCLDSDSKDQIWICTNQGLAVLSGGRSRILTAANGLPSNQIRSTCESGDGTRWVAGLDFGLARWNGSRFETYSDSKISPKENVTALACGGDGTVWAGTNAGLIQIRKGLSRTLTTRDGLPDNAVSSLTEGPDGNLWIGTNDGISRYRGGDVSIYRTLDGLSHSLVLSLYVDREGSLWAGTKDGLDQFTDGKVTPYTTNEGLLGNDAGPVLEDTAGRLWIGTLGQGLNWFNGHRFRAVTTKNGLIDNTILSLELDRSGDIWAGTEKGLNRLRNGQVIATYTRHDGLPGSEIRALFEDTQGTLWAGGDKGLSRFDGTRFTKEEIGTKSSPDGIVALAGGRTVQLFVSTDAPGFYAMRNNQWSGYALDVLRSVDCYFLDRVRHSAWMGTLGSGLLRWQNGTFTHVRVKDGLYDNRIYSIVRDDSANFWMASSKGIFRVSQKELDDFADGKSRSVTSIPFSTGQLRFECQSGVQPAACRTRDGRLWFSTTNGLVVVDPNHLSSNKIPPSVQLTALLIDGQRVDPLKEAQLKPSEKNIEIRYAGLSFISPEKVSFRYILDGYDKAWTEAGTRREAFFTNLPPGHYQFKVMSRNADGVWSTQAAALGFMIEPRLYQRRWFFPLIALLAGLGIAAGYRLRFRQLNKRFDLILAERSRIARELHDTLLQGLSGITMQLQALRTRLPASREKQFLGEIIQDAGRCSAEARQSLWGLRAIGSGRSLEFSDKLARLSRQAVDGKPISLTLKLQPVSLNSRPEVEYQLLRIVQETISNTLSHAGAKDLEIRLIVQNKQLNLTLEDNGIGFDRESASERFGHFGLIGMHERADEIGAELTVDSLPGRGTKVSIRVPLSESDVPEGKPDVDLEHQLK
jgi:ligand-binding sensor domain-containing protein/signal transduction histidine kinase